MSIVRCWQVSHEEAGNYIDEMLREAAHVWMATYGVPPQSQGSEVVATSENRFLDWAEAAFEEVWLERKTAGEVPIIAPPLKPRPIGKRQPLPLKVRQAILERDGAVCVTCGATTDLSIDHIIAVANGGSDDPSNLRVLCRPCNSRKGAR